jgi:hypothetical protein
MTRGIVLDPTAAPVADVSDPGPDAGSLAGKVVGIRHDDLWRSFDWVTEEWVAALTGAGAEVTTWRAGHRVGPEASRTAAELEAFIDSVDVAIIGLAN